MYVAPISKAEVGTFWSWTGGVREMTLMLTCVPSGDTPVTTPPSRCFKPWYGFCSGMCGRGVRSAAPLQATRVSSLEQKGRNRRIIGIVLKMLQMDTRAWCGEVGVMREVLKGKKGEKGKEWVSCGVEEVEGEEVGSKVQYLSAAVGTSLTCVRKPRLFAGLLALLRDAPICIHMPIDSGSCFNAVRRQ